MTKKLNILYYGFYAVYVLEILLLGKVLHLAALDPMSSAGQAVQYVTITYIIASIPGALYFFKRYMKNKVSKIEDKDAQNKAYFYAAVVRMTVICLGAIIAIVAFYLLGQNIILKGAGARNSYSMLWCAGISLIAQFFCKPNEKKIYMEKNDLREDDPRMGDAEK